MAQGPGFPVTGLTIGETYTAVVFVHSDPGAPPVAAAIDGGPAGEWVTTPGPAAARVVFVATATTHTVRLAADIVDGRSYGDTWARAFLVTPGEYLEDGLYAGALVTIYDHEARQGTTADYILADADGAQQAATTVRIPEWGTWLKSPGRPYLNVRVHLSGAGSVKRPAVRQRVRVEGSGQDVVLSQRRRAREGQVRLSSLTDAGVAAVERVLDDGLTVMLDTTPDWQLPYRYVSIGDVTLDRPMGEELGLDRPSRVFVLEDVVEVDTPVGVTVVDRGRTYATLPALYGSYAAMAATNSAYDTLAVGA